MATAGLPTQANVAEPTSSPVTSTNAWAGTAFTTAFPATGSISLLSSRLEIPSSAALTAPVTASVIFESSAFTAAPVATRRSATSARARSVRRTTVQAKALPAKAVPVKAAPGKAVHVKIEQVKVVHVKAKPAVAKPAVVKPAHAKAAVVKPAAAKPAHKKPAPAKAATSRAARPAKTAPAKTKPAKTTNRHVAAPAKSSHASSTGSAVLAVAARYVGTPYVYGGTSPRGFDCSGYTGYVYRQLGKSLPRTADQQMRATRRISRTQARAGDLVFFVSGGRAYHVGIYAGGGMMYDAPHTGKRVQKRAIWDAAVVFGRVTG
jgi:peptidoglycan DL-endopeptidase CwlO